jgi:predicted ester cyclase
MDLRGREGFRQFITMYRTAFPDLRVTIDDLISEGDKVCAASIVQSTFKGNMMGMAPTGKPFTVKLMAANRFEGGKESEVLEVFDRLSFFQQLGIIPPMGPVK